MTLLRVRKSLRKCVDAEAKSGFSCNGKIGPMADLGKRMTGWLAALLLSALTLSVFAVLQNYGPESAVRRFHEAAVNRNAEQLRRVSVRDLQDMPTRYLTFRVDELIRSGTRIQIRRTIREPRRVLVEVRYFFPGGGQTSLWWHVERQPNGEWRVNARRTLELARMRLGF